MAYFFIPIANLFMPYLVMKELWQASSSRSHDQWRLARVSPLLGAWWAAELLFSIVHYGPVPILLGKRGLTEFLKPQLGFPLDTEAMRWQAGAPSSLDFGVGPVASCEILGRWAIHRPPFLALKGH